MNFTLRQRTLLPFLLAGTLYAEESMTTSNNVIRSTDPASVALTGETVSAPPPRAMTDSSENAVFVTLTRTPLGRKQLPTNTETITAEQIRELSAQNAGEAIAALSGVRIHRQGQLGSTQLAGIRGASSNQTLVMIDGRPVGGVGLSASQDLSEIPVEQIDRIEIVRGGVSALYGPNALGGVINVISKRASHQGLPISHFGTEGRSFAGQTYSLDFGSRQGPFDFFFFGNRSRESGFRLNQDVMTHNLGGNVGLALGKAGKVLFDISSYHANAGVPGQLFPDVPPNQYDGNTERRASTPSARQRTGTDAVRMSYILPLPMDTFLTLRLFGSQRGIKFADPNFLTNTARDEHSKGGEIQMNLPHGLLAGGTFIRDRLDNRDRTTPANSFVRSVENWGWFFQQNWSWQRLTIIPSVRFDNNSQFGESTNPRLQGMLEAADFLRLSASAARSFRAPTLDDLYYPFTDFGFGFSYQGNPNLRPEKAWTYDAGFELHNSSASLKLTYFRANVSDLIQTTSDLASTTVNIGRARRQGAELQVEKTWNRWFSERLNYTYLENRGTPAGFADEVELRLSPRHVVNYRARFTFRKGFFWDHTLRGTGRYYEGNNRTGDKMSSTLIWDTRLQFPIRQVDFYVGLNNVLRKHYRERSGYPLPGRTIYGGVRLRMWG